MQKDFCHNCIFFKILEKFVIDCALYSKWSVFNYIFLNWCQKQTKITSRENKVFYQFFSRDSQGYRDIQDVKPYISVDEYLFMYFCAIACISSSFLFLSFCVIVEWPQLFLPFIFCCVMTEQLFQSEWHLLYNHATNESFEAINHKNIMFFEDKLYF